MRKFLLRCSFFLPIIFFIIIFNITVDPARLFKNKDYERKIAEELTAGHAVTDLDDTNFDDRSLEKFLIQGLKKKKDVAILGSSRVMVLSSDLFPGKKLLNNGLSSASMEDFIILYEIYRESHVLPTTIIIGVDPWDFNKNNTLFKWQQFGICYSRSINSKSNYYFDFKIRFQDFISPIFQQLISASYFQAGIRYLFSRNFKLTNHHMGFTKTHLKCNEKQTILPDGSRVYSKVEREINPDEVVRKIQIQNSQNDATYLEGFDEVDQGLKNEFIGLVRKMKNDGVNVVIYLPPYHPCSYDYYIRSSRFKIIKDVEDFVRKISEECRVTLIGSYDPHQLAIPESAFLDEIHLKNDDKLKGIFVNGMSPAAY